MIIYDEKTASEFQKALIELIDERIKEITKDKTTEIKIQPIILTDEQGDSCRKLLKYLQIEDTEEDIEEQKATCFVAALKKMVQYD